MSIIAKLRAAGSPRRTSSPLVALFVALGGSSYAAVTIRGVPDQKQLDPRLEDQGELDPGEQAAKQQHHRAASSRNNTVSRAKLRTRRPRATAVAGTS